MHGHNVWFGPLGRVIAFFLFVFFVSFWVELNKPKSQGLVVLLPILWPGGGHGQGRRQKGPQLGGPNFQRSELTRGC